MSEWSDTWPVVLVSYNPSVGSVQSGHHHHLIEIQLVAMIKLKRSSLGVKQQSLDHSLKFKISRIDRIKYKNHKLNHSLK